MGPAQEEKPSLHFPWQLRVRITPLFYKGPKKKIWKEMQKELVFTHSCGIIPTGHSWYMVFMVISIILLGWHKNFHREPQNNPARSESGPSNNGHGNWTFPLNSISWERRHSLISIVTKKTPNSHIRLSSVTLACSVEKGRNQCLQAELVLEEPSTCSGSKGYSWPGVQRSMC